MNFAGRTIASFVLALSVGLCTTSISTPTANASEYVDMNVACKLTNGAGWVAQLTYPSQGAYGWRCWVPPFGVVKKGASVQKYCRYIYGLNAYNTGGAYSWYCA